MAPRPGYGIPLGGISLMAAPDSEVEKFIGGTCGTLKSWKQVKDQFRNPKGFGFAEYADADSVLRVLRVLGGEARERERQREEEERANRRAKAEKERERSHERENRERESERERERDCDRGRDRDRQARERLMK
ncbi:hypothetical protein RhiirA1_446380 [Rhizophagus irregularis]|uniref:RRM domain-containing protein n=1 Tax=Rhizophagus irregularis TaxID=588596 RepID=A0A2N0R0T8_9GLOM|nr:hypothetical protein RhiirA1_446380 [Rhizophagus irregularis]